MLGEKIRNLREKKGMFQRQLAAALDIDTAYISKIENEDKPLPRVHLERISELLDASLDELLTLWIADKVYEIVKDEKIATQALKSVSEKITEYK